MGLGACHTVPSAPLADPHCGKLAKASLLGEGQGEGSEL